MHSSAASPLSLQSTTPARASTKRAKTAFSPSTSATDTCSESEWWDKWKERDLSMKVQGIGGWLPLNVNDEFDDEDHRIWFPAHKVLGVRPPSKKLKSDVQFTLGGRKYVVLTFLHVSWVHVGTWHAKINGTINIPASYFKAVMSGSVGNAPHNVNYLPNPVQHELQQSRHPLSVQQLLTRGLTWPTTLRSGAPTPSAVASAATKASPDSVSLPATGMDVETTTSPSVPPVPEPPSISRQPQAPPNVADSPATFCRVCKLLVERPRSTIASQEKAVMNVLEKYKEEIERAESLILPHLTENVRRNPVAADKTRALMYALMWGYTPGGWNSRRIATAAVKQASADNHWTRNMTADPARSLRRWYGEFIKNTLHPADPKEETRGRRTLDNVYGFELLCSLYRAAIKELTHEATFIELATHMQDESAKTNKAVVLSGQALRTWFLKHKGVFRAKTSKPDLSEENKKRRLAFCKQFLEAHRAGKHKYYFFIDEKWFYLESGRTKMKCLPKQAHELEEAAFVPVKKLRSRRFVLKKMFMGVVGYPVKEEKDGVTYSFDGKAILHPCVTIDPYKRAVTESNFVSSIEENNELIETWKGCGSADSTKEEMQEAVHNDWKLDFPKEEIVFVREAKPARFNDAGKKTHDHKLEYLNDKQTFGDRFDEYYIRHRISAGSKREKQEIVNSEFMLKVLEHNIGPAIKEKLHWLNYEDPNLEIILQFDNAGGHGTDAAKETYTKLMWDKFKIRCVFQSAQSPEFNALDLGVWMTVQAAVSKLSRGLRMNIKSLTECVNKAWDELEEAKLQSIVDYVPIAMQGCIDDNGGNKKCESTRSTKEEKLTARLLPEKVPVRPSWTKIVKAESKRDDEEEEDEDAVDEGFVIDEEEYDPEGAEDDEWTNLEAGEEEEEEEEED